MVESYSVCVAFSLASFTELNAFRLLRVFSWFGSSFQSVLSNTPPCGCTTVFYPSPAEVASEFWQL